jgi:integrase
MGVIKDRHGTYYAQRRVPEPLQAAVARVLNNGKRKQVFLKKSLGTKILKEANFRAKPVQMSFDQTLRRAAEFVAAKSAPPKTTKRQSLNPAEITRIAEALIGRWLAWDEEQRFNSRASVARFAEWMRRNEDPDFVLPYPLESVPKFGISPDRFEGLRQQHAEALANARELLARGDISIIEVEMGLLLGEFDIDLDRKSPSYHELGMHLLRAYVRALEAVEKRDAGTPIETPKFTLGFSSAPDGASLRDALEGWKKERTRPQDTVSEYTRAIEMFIDLHGNLPVAEIKRSHASEFREALMLVPRTRSGALLKAGLRDLGQWGREHPEAPKVSAGTVNKQLGAVQAIGLWGFSHGLVPDDAPWSDPFKNKRLPEERSTRGPFEAHGLKTIFSAPLFTNQEIPEGGKGPAAFWLPLLALFMGARQAEFAGLRVSDIREDTGTGTPLMWIVADRKVGRRVKTETSERVVPIHSSLCKLGFLDFVAERRREGEKAWLFLPISPDQRGGLKAWSKWWGHYLREHIGIEDRDLVFHSFRHGFTDRARAAGVSEEVRKALMGHSDASTVSGGYGAKNMLARWGVNVLKEAIEKITYPGLDLSRVRPPGSTRRTRGTEAIKANRPAST